MNKINKYYNEDFYKNQRDGSLQSAKIIVPLVNKLIKPKSVIDVGCGTGTWLSVFKELGVKIHGIDGDYVKSEMLLIDQSEFTPSDLSQRIPSTDKFDLAVSLEVAEHLPNERAESFVRDLCSLAPIVLFSAAIPFQGGINHINEQWQNYWVDLFKKNNYFAFDVIRPQVSKHKGVDINYRNNTIIFCNKELVPPELKEYPNNLNSDISFNLVNPDSYLKKRFNSQRYERKYKKYKKLTNLLSFCVGTLLLILIFTVSKF